MAGNGSANGNGHNAQVPASAPPGAGTAPAPAKEVPEQLKKNAWKKGESGNPKGTVPGTIRATSAIDKILRDKSPRNKRISNLEEWQEIAKARARKGDWRGAELLFNKWAPDQRIPDNAAAGPAGVQVNLNNYEQMITATEPTSGAGDRPTFGGDN